MYSRAIYITAICLRQGGANTVVIFVYWLHCAPSAIALVVSVAVNVVSFIFLLECI